MKKVRNLTVAQILLYFLFSIVANAQLTITKMSGAKMKRRFIKI